MIRPRWLLTNVHVTVSSIETLMLVTGLPSLQMAEDCDHPAGTVSERE
jgi:hypothetical protein